MTSLQRSSFAILRELVPERDAKQRCELCGRLIADEHAHLLEPVRRQVMCVCEECAISRGEQSDEKYRRVPQRVRLLSDFQLTDGQWDDLLIPVGMAYFFYSSPLRRVTAFYPSPAGPTESLLRLETWQQIVLDNPALHDMQPDVEALLVNRLHEAREYFIVPIDRCYELVGLIRSYWRGLSGGSEVWEEIAKFYATLNKQSQLIGESAHA